MREYEFTLKFAVPPSDDGMSGHVERLASEGCDDALVGVGRPDRIALAFTREGASASASVLSAIADVGRAIPGAVLVEAAPDLVSATDIADLVGCSRQNVRNLMLDCRAIVPAPVHEGRPSIWHLAPVLVWLRDRKGYRIGEELLELAGTTMQVNLAIDQRRADRRIQEEIHAVLA